MNKFLSVWELKLTTHKTHITFSPKKRYLVICLNLEIFLKSFLLGNLVIAYFSFGSKF